MDRKSKLLEWSSTDEPIKEIVGKSPNCLLRWGFASIAIFFMLLIGLSFVIQYPEIINSSLKLTQENAPKPLVVNASGKLVKLFFKNGDTVKTGNSIGYIESTAQHQAVLDLMENLQQIETLLQHKDYQALSNIVLEPNNTLGELQGQFQTFFQSLVQIKNYVGKGFATVQIELLKAELNRLKALHEQYQIQQNLFEKDLALSQQTFEMNKHLNSQKIISDNDFRTEDSKFLNKQQNLPPIKIALLNNEMAQSEKTKEIISLENTKTQQKLLFETALSAFKSQVAEWERKYILKASTDGIVSIANVYQVNAQLNQNQVIGYIIPPKTEYVGLVTVSQQNFGKIQLNQKVIIQFQAYPFQEYGFVRGEVENVLDIPNDNNYLLKIKFIDGLNTSNHRQLAFKEGLMANAAIITHNLSIIQRLYYNLIKRLSH